MTIRPDEKAPPSARFTHEQRVANGAELLDEYCAEYCSTDWRDEIDVDTLDIESCGHCILGQLFGEYQNGVIALARHVEVWADQFFSPSDHGFSYTSTPNHATDVKGLNEAWRKELA